ncbi:MAG: DUF1926 domain-containing protein [Myxococcales bacterium]|nr:MAG: DUF1926 domain-containing protein [Myxococcales bacterium]
MPEKTKLSFILGVHCHQPVGNFGWVIEEAFEKSYRPFVESLEKRPEIKAAAHFSGPLLEWIEANRRDFFKKIRKLVERGQMEIIGGGFYEPILMTIPQVDRLEQIEMMSTYADTKLGMRPKGLWLTERIWEPSLPGVLRAAGMAYTVTDDTHFLQAGVEPDKVRGYYYTEDEGYTCAVFPIDQTLRYAIPFRDPEETIKYLRRRYDAGDRTCCSLLDDGEKFGLWPGTFNLLYKEGWLERFYNALEKASDWLEITLPSDYMQTNPAEGLVYLPTASYFEMGQWALSPSGNQMLDTLKHRLSKEYGPNADVFVKGGFFRNFFMRYPEANHMHKRMLEISRKVHQSALEGLPRDEAKRELFQAQCNCGYWHGIFGGLYLPHLREAIYEHLLKAERIVDDRELAIDAYDIDRDGKEEVELRNRKLVGLFAPHDGGTLIELDAVEAAANLMNTLARRPEAYHTPKKQEEPADGSGSIHEIAKEISAADRKLLVYDPYRRSSFRDFWLEPGAALSPEGLRDLKYKEIGGLPRLSYTPELEERADEVTLHLEGQATLPAGKLDIVKRFVLHHNQSALRAQYHLTLREGDVMDGLLGIQFNVSTPSALTLDAPFAVDGKAIPGHKLLVPGKHENASRFRIRDPHRRVDFTIDIDRKASMMWHAIETLSQSESGFDRNYQASALWILLPVRLSPRETQALSIIITIDDATG